MKKLIYLVFLLTPFFALGQTIDNLNKDNGFRDAYFGSELSSFKDIELQEVKGREKRYTRKSEKLETFGSKADKITYYFYDDKLYAINIAISYSSQNENTPREVHNNLKSRYGEESIKNSKYKDGLTWATDKVYLYIKEQEVPDVNNLYLDIFIASIPMMENITATSQNETATLTYLIKDKYTLTFNKGVYFYKMKDYSKAIEEFRKALVVEPNSIQALHYVANAAMEQKDYVAAKKASENLLYIYSSYNDNVVRDNVQPILTNLIYIAKTENNTQKMSELLTMAVRIFPDNKKFVEQDLILNISKLEPVEAVQKVQAALKNDPDNSNLHNTLGNLYEKTSQLEMAIASYKQAIAKNENNFEAIFNAGTYYYNKGALLNKKANKMEEENLKEESAAVIKSSKVQFAEALPFFVKAHNIRQDDSGTMKVLINIYTVLDRKSDADQIKAKLNK